MDTQQNDYLREAVKHLTALRKSTPSIVEDANSTQYSGAFDEEDLQHADRPPTTSQNLERPSGHDTVHHPHDAGCNQVPHDAISATALVPHHPSELRTPWFSRPKTAEEDPASTFTFARITLPTTFSVKPSRGPTVETILPPLPQNGNLDPPLLTIPSLSSLESEGVTNVTTQRQHQGTHPEADNIDRPPDKSHQSVSQLQPHDESKVMENSIPQLYSPTIPVAPDGYIAVQRKASSQQISRLDASEGHTRISGERTAPSSQHSQRLHQSEPDERDAALDNEDSCLSGSTILPDTVRNPRDQSTTQLRTGSSGKRFAQWNNASNSEAPQTPHTIRSGSVNQTQDATKVQKSSQKPKFTPSKRPKDIQRMNLSQHILSEEEMLIALLKRCKNEARDRAKARSRERAKDTEIGDLKEIIHILHDQVLEREEELAKREAELEKVKGLVPGWRNRLKKLIDYVKGLNNDHRQLRDNATEIQAQQMSLREEKDLLDTALCQSVLAVQQEREQHKDNLKTNQNQIQILEQNLYSQKSQLASEREALQVERVASQKLQETLSQITINHQGAISKIEEQAQLILNKLAEAPPTISTAGDSTSPIEQSEIKTKLEDCLKFLHEMRQVEGPSRENLVALGVSFREQAHQISEQIRHFEQSWQSNQSFQWGITPEIEHRFHEIASLLEANQPLNEQIIGLREVKATIAERLKATENSLIESRQRALILERDEQAHSQKTSALEAELNTLRKQPQESPLLLLRLHESEKECKVSNDKLLSNQIELSQITDMLRERCEELAEVKAGLREAQSQLIDAQVRATTLSEEKDTIIAKKAQDERQLKIERAEMIEHEITRAENRLQNQMQKLRHQNAIAKDELEKQRALVETLQKQQENTLATTDREQSSIAELRQKLQASEDLADRKAREVEEQSVANEQLMREAVGREDAIDELRKARIRSEQDIRHYQSQIQDLEARNANLQELYDKDCAASKSQEEEIRKLKVEVADLRSLPQLKSRPTVNLSSTPLLVNAHGQNTRSLVVEDSQDKLTKPAATQQPREAVVDDSQNTHTTARAQHPRPLSADELSSPIDPLTKENQIERLTRLPPDLDYEDLFPPSPVVDDGKGLPKTLDPKKALPAGNGEKNPDLFQQHCLNISRSTTRTTLQSTVAPGSTTLSPWFSQVPYQTLNQHRPESSQSQRSRKPVSRSQPQPKSILKQSSAFKQPKRTIPDSQDTQGRAKRRRMSTEVESQNLGPTVRTPSADVRSSRRKVSLRSSQKESEMDRVFSQSLRAPSRQSTPA